MKARLDPRIVVASTHGRDASAHGRVAGAARTTPSSQGCWPIKRPRYSRPPGRCRLAADPSSRIGAARQSMSEAITLYDAHGSPCARRVRAVLLEKGLSWTTRLVDLTRMEQKRPEYLALSPNGVVPTLVHGERVLYESNVITEYLDDVFPDPPLYP